MTCRNVKNIIHTISADFHSERFNTHLFELVLKILTKIIRSQKPTEHEPSKFYVMYGEDSGLKLIETNIKWPFTKGLYFYCHFFIQDFLQEEMCLMTLTVGDESFSVIIDHQGWLKIKLINIIKPVQLCQLTTQQWYTINLAYYLKPGMISNSYELTCWLNEDIFEKKQLPIPNISMKD